MVKLNLEQILETTDTIVQELLATGEFGDCTFKDVLFRVDARLEFPRGTLLRYEHKNTVKERIKVLLSQAEEAGDQTPSPPKKRTAGRGPDAGEKSNKRRKSDTAKSNQEGSDTEPESKKAKKPRPTPKPKVKETKVDRVSKSEAKKSSIKPKSPGNKPAISAETIDSDLDDTDPGPSTSTFPPEKESKRKLAESDDGRTTGPSQVTKPKHSPQRPKTEQTARVGDAFGNKSESELSVLLDDEPPKRRRKAKSEKAETPKEARKKKEKKELSRDEETIKRLKSLVVACGVRKVWSKEFKDLDSPSAQIKRLKSILTELGMSGRMSMEQARVIKEKREFAQELEDIQNFEKKVVGKSEGRSSRKKLGSIKGAESPSEDSESDDDDQGEDEDEPRKKRINARNSIMAFLEDQSDED